MVTAEQVTGPAAEQQQPAKGERVGGEDPFQPVAGEAEGPLDVWQRHVHDAGVEHHHQLCGRDDEQGESDDGAGPSGPLPVTGPGAVAGGAFVLADKAVSFSVRHGLR